MSYLTLAISPFCIAFAVVWGVKRQLSFAWIGQDILVRESLYELPLLYCVNSLLYFSFIVVCKWMKGLTDNIVTSFFPPLQSGYCTNNHSSSNCSCPKSQGNDLNSLAFHGNWLEIYAGSAIILSCSLLILCVSHVRRYLLSSTHYSSLKLYSSTSLFQKKK